MSTNTVLPLVPPLLRAIEAPEPFETALLNLRAGDAGIGAGDLFWSPQKLVSNLAIVLEPDVSARDAMQMIPLAMVALGDCLGVLVPPQVAVQFRHPLQIVVNGGVAGNVTATMAPTQSEDEVPAWLVLGIETGLARADDALAPGLQPDLTTLDEEGSENLNHIKFIETYARHFLSWMAIWQEEGFAPIARSWKFKAEDESDPDMAKIHQAVAKIERAE